MFDEKNLKVLKWVDDHASAIRECRKAIDHARTYVEKAREADDEDKMVVFEGFISSYEDEIEREKQLIIDIINGL